MEVSSAFASSWVLRIEIDGEKKLKRLGKDYTMATIAEKINEAFAPAPGGNSGLQIIFSDDNDTIIKDGREVEHLVLRVRLKEDEDGGGEVEEGVPGTQDYEMLRKLEKNILGNTRLQGIEGIKKVYTNKKDIMNWNDEKGFEKSKEWILETDGSNLAAVMSLEDVNHTTTYCNDVFEIANTLGVESARAAIFNEVRTTLGVYGAYVNYRHIACLSDCMTFNGGLLAVNRHGVNAGDSGPMLR